MQVNLVGFLQAKESLERAVLLQGYDDVPLLSEKLFHDRFGSDM